MLTVSDQQGFRLVEGPQDLPLMRTSLDATIVIEACFSGKARAALLYASNLPSRFFDLSSGEAGEILQKFRQYRIRLAVVRPPGAVPFSSRFPELLAEESSKPYFGVFDSCEAAKKWLAAPNQTIP